jgi:hypothetical protein
MIYLFDDNTYGQLSENYRVNYMIELPKHKDIITHFQKHDDKAGYDFIQTANALLVHDSFPNGDQYSDSSHKTTMIEYAKQEKIPYVLFSNSFTTTTYDENQPNSIATIKKDRFYYNLLSFIEHFRIHKTIKIEILAIGAHYEKEKTLIIQDKFGKFLLQRGKNFDYESDITEGKEYYKILKELFLFKFGSNHYESAFETFDNKACEDSISAKILKNYIKKLVNEIIIKYDE